MLSCKIQAKPEPNIVWKKDDQPLIASDRIKITKDDESHTLTITKSTKNDTGKYFCEAENKAGSSKTTSNVTVTGNNLALNCLHMSKRDQFSEPSGEFTVKLNDVEAKENGEIVLQCTVSKENAKTEWSKDGYPLKPGKDYQISESGSHRKLVIKSAQMTHTGVYSCSSGKRKTSAKVNVVGRRW